MRHIHICKQINVSVKTEKMIHRMYVFLLFVTVTHIQETDVFHRERENKNRIQ